MEKEKLYFIKIYFNGGGIIHYDGLTRERVEDFRRIDFRGFYIDPMMKVNEVFTANAYDLINFDAVLMIEVGLSENLPLNTRYGRTHNLMDK